VSSRKTQEDHIRQRRSPRYAQFSELSLTYEGNTARRFPEGAIMKLRFRLSRSGIEVHARAEVRYCLPGVGIGVEFIGLDPEYVHAIEEEIAGTPVIG